MSVRAAAVGLALLLSLGGCAVSDAPADSQQYYADLRAERAQRTETLEAIRAIQRQADAERDPVQKLVLIERAQAMLDALPPLPRVTLLPPPPLPAMSPPNVMSPLPGAATDQQVYSASECTGPVVMGVCHGGVIPNGSNHPTCHGQMLNGMCTGPMF